MKRVIGTLLLAGMASCGMGTPMMVLAQTAPEVPAKVEVPQQLNYVETAAVQAMVEKIQTNAKERAALVQQVHRIEADIVAAHPGYHLDEGSGSLVKDAPAEKPKGDGKATAK